MNACPYCHRDGCSPTCPGPARVGTCPECGGGIGYTADGRAPMHVCRP